MKSIQKLRMLGTVVPLVSVAGLSGCSYFQRPGEVCSTQETYNGLEKLIAFAAPADDEAKTALAASLGPNFTTDAYLKLISSYMSFKLPTVDAVDKDTGKVSCNVLLTLTGPQEAVVVGRSADPNALVTPVPVNDQSSDHITYRVSFSAQRTADGTSNAIILERAPQIAAITQAFIAKAESLKASSPVSAPAPSEQVIENQPEPQPASPADGDGAAGNDASSAIPPASGENPDGSSTSDGQGNSGFLRNIQQ